MVSVRILTTTTTTTTITTTIPTAAVIMITSEGVEVAAAAMEVDILPKDITIPSVEMEVTEVTDGAEVEEEEEDSVAAMLLQGDTILITIPSNK